MEEIDFTINKKNASPSSEQEFSLDWYFTLGEAFDNDVLMIVLGNN